MTISPSRVTIRAAVRDDTAAMYQLAAAHDVHLEGPEGMGPPYLDRLFGEGTVLAAEREGRVVGFAAAVWIHPAAGSTQRRRSHVSDLFVEPSEHGSGVGGPLYRALLEAHVDERWSVSSSGDPRAQALYTRGGMVPAWPLFYLQRPRSAADRRLPAPPRDAIVRRISADELTAAFAELSGFDRQLDVITWSSRRGGTPFAVELDGRLALAGCVRDGHDSMIRWFDSAVIAANADPVVALATALESRELAPEGAAIGLCLGGPHPALKLLLDAGFRIVERDTWCETPLGLLDPARVVPDPSVG
jgi:GNAT superfamily N-acetyltransferase